MNQVPAWAGSIVSPLDQKLGLEITEMSPQRVVASMPVAGNEQPLGLLHGGASAAMVETLGSFAAMAYGWPDRAGVGVDLNVTHLRSARSGRVTGTATAVHLGRTVVTYQVDIVDDEGRQTATGRLTCQMVPLPPAARQAQ